jgi:hypothetical protein
MAKRKARSRTRTTARQSKRKLSARRARPAKRSPKRPVKRPAARKAARASKPAKRAKRSAPRKAPKSSRPKPAALQRERRRLAEDVIPGAPSTLGYAQKASSAESGHQMYNQKKREHTEGGPELTGGDLDSDWNDAYSSGEETPGGDMSTPDQDVVEEIGRALGVEYEDAEELKGSEKIIERDRNRWEYDPASAEDYRDRNKKQ